MTSQLVLAQIAPDVKNFAHCGTFVTSHSLNRYWTVYASRCETSAEW